MATTTFSSISATVRGRDSQRSSSRRSQSTSSIPRGRRSRVRHAQNPGRAHYSNATLKRGVAGALNLYQWINDVRNGNVRAARTVTIQLQTEDRTDIVWTWRLLRAWPVKYRFTNLEAKGKDVLIETLELSVERVEVE